MKEELFQSSSSSTASWAPQPARFVGTSPEPSRRGQGRRNWRSGWRGGPEQTPRSFGILALSLAGSLKLNSIFPLSGFGNAPLARYAVIVFLTLIGLAAMGSAIACIHAARDAADIIYRRMGPYGLSRNPMSLGLIAVYGAIAVAADAPAALASLPVAFWLIEVFAVLPNERRLKGQMGLSFENYCRDVPRWI